MAYFFLTLLLLPFVLLRQKWGVIFIGLSRFCPTMVKWGVCWFIPIGSFCFDKNASISWNFLYRDFHNRDTVFPEVSRRIFAEDLFQYGKG
jgi:hypothetical protein